MINDTLNLTLLSSALHFQEHIFHCGTGLLCTTGLSFNAKGGKMTSSFSTRVPA